MTRRRAIAVLVAAFALLAAVNALLWSMYRDEARTVARGLDDRLLALGATAAKWLATEPQAPGTLLAALVSENHLEDAYVVDGKRRVIDGVRTPAGSALNLLRIDSDRLTSARAGEVSVGAGYSLDQVGVEVAYFPLAHDSGAVLALEAGAEYHAPERRVYTSYLIGVALTVLVAIVFATALVLALRALERARLAHGRAERLAGVGQMAAMVAHEVRNPLGVLRGQVELARERLGETLPPRERERFSEMIGEIERLNRLTEEFLGLAREMPLAVEDVELGGLVTTITQEAQLAVPAARIECIASERELRARIDPARLKQALLNLVLNAAQAGGSGVHVRVEVERVRDHARLNVVDDGPGVPPAIAATLFEPFVGSRPGGSGLGLAVARRVAERHGGTLVLESTPGAKGARFTLSLPLG